MRAGSPGMTRATPKIRIETPIRTTTEAARRRSRYLATAAVPFARRLSGPGYLSISNVRKFQLPPCTATPLLGSSSIGALT